MIVEITQEIFQMEMNIKEIIELIINI